MKFERINIWEESEYRYSAAFGFQPNLRTYLHEDADVKPCVLVIPGGGYRMVVPSEGEIIAKCFNDKGYQAFVGTYTTNFLGLEPLKLQPLKDISRMVRLIRARADEFHVIPDRIVICGFSAGAHLCGALCVHGQDVRDSLYPSVRRRPPLRYYVRALAGCAGQSVSLRFQSTGWRDPFLSRDYIGRIRTPGFVHRSAWRSSVG